MEVLIGRFREGIWLWHSNLSCGFFQLLEHQPVVHGVDHAPLSFGMSAQEVLRNSLSVGEATSFVIVVRASSSWASFAHDLGSGAELESLILRVIFNDSLIFVKGS